MDQMQLLQEASRGPLRRFRDAPQRLLGLLQRTERGLDAEDLCIGQKLGHHLLEMVMLRTGQNVLPTICAKQLETPADLSSTTLLQDYGTEWAE